MAVLDRTETVVPPSEWSVVFHNDSTTPASLVAYILTNVFRYDEAQAMAKVLEIEKNGHGSVGRYPRSIAETKQSLAAGMAKNAGYDLKITLEKDE